MRRLSTSRGVSGRDTIMRTITSKFRNQFIAALFGTLPLAACGQGPDSTDAPAVPSLSEPCSDAAAGCAHVPWIDSASLPSAVPGMELTLNGQFGAGTRWTEVTLEIGGCVVDMPV